MNRLGPIFATLAVLIALSPTKAPAHDAVQFETSGKLLKIDTSKAAEKHKLIFKTAKQEFNPKHDPSQFESTLLVRWLGTSGGKSALITLDNSKWSGIGNPAGSKGYKYKDADASAGGIKAVVLKKSPTRGSLKITAKGANYPWELDGPHDSVWVHFSIEDESYCAEFGGDIKKNEPGKFLAKNAAAPAECPEQTCGNGTTEIGEECDDGNAVEDDGCTSECLIGECSGTEYDSTLEAIQAIIFDEPIYSCSSQVCHGAGAASGGLDLSSASAAYANLINVPSSTSPQTARVVPGDETVSVLYDKLHAGTNAVLPTYGGSPMPSGATPLTAAHLEAIRLWIRGGAPEDLVVDGTQQHLATCLPEPDPVNIPQPDPPGAGIGAQFQQTPYFLGAQSEREICMSTYYDLTQTNLVPASARFACTDYPVETNPSQECFRWHRQVLAQDPKSHHSIIHIYQGNSTTADPEWGPWTYKLRDTSDPQQGQACDPTDVDPALGINPNCSGSVQNSIACIGYGPTDAQIGFAGGFSGSQESYYDQELSDGVYAVSPMSGIIVWNSHAFNTTGSDSTMDQFLNLDFAAPADQLYEAQQIFDSSDIFIMDVPPFEQREYCGNYVIPSGSSLFQLSSHTHQWGVNFRIWGPPNSSCTPGLTCTEGPPSQLMYTSTVYNDPLQLAVEPPIVYSGNTNNRRFRFCSLYDNGSGPGSPAVKQNSTLVGSGCSTSVRACMDGPNKGQVCNGDDSFCDSTPGAGDGVCDACPVIGGITTQDEMFIMLGLYY